MNQAYKRGFNVAAQIQSGNLVRFPGEVAEAEGADSTSAEFHGFCAGYSAGFVQRFPNGAKMNLNNARITAKPVAVTLL